MNDFLDNLKQSLLSSGVGEFKTSEILKQYKSYFADGRSKGLTESELLNKIEPLSLCVNTFAPTKEVYYSSENTSSVKKKKSQFVMSISLLSVLLINIISVPISLLLLVAMLALYLVPIVISLISVGALLYGLVIVNGYEIFLSPLTRFSLPIGCIGLSIILIFLISWIFNRYLKFTTWYYSLQSNLLRRYK